MPLIIKVSDIIPYMEQGFTNKQLAKKFRKSPVTIARWVGRLKKQGITVPTRQTGRPKLKI